MKVWGIRSLGIAALCMGSFGLLSCGNDPRLVSIAVGPQNTTISGVDCTLSPCQPTIQFRAIGFYNHGGKAKDITNQVIWSTDAPTILQFQSSPAGLLAPTGNGCGTNLGAIATVYENGTIITGQGVVNVIVTGCP